MARRLIAMTVFCLALLGFISSAFAEVDGKAASKLAMEKIKAMPGFVAVYRGESTQSDTRPEVYIGYAKQDKLFIRVPVMNFYASYESDQIRIQSSNSGILMPFNEVKQLNMEAERGFLDIKWLKMIDSSKMEMNPRLSFELAKGTLNIGISFGPEKEPFSWLAALRSTKATLTQDNDHWIASYKSKTGGKYIYWISKKTGVLVKMTDEKDGKILRRLELVDFRETPPEDHLFTDIFSDGVKVERFGNSPSQKVQYLIGLYDGIQQALLYELLPKWKTLDIDGRKAVAGAVSIYWKTVYRNVFHYQKENLLSALKDPKLAENVIKIASNKTAYEKFVSDLPDDKTTKSKELWQEQILGQVGFELLDPFVGWTRARYITPAKETITKVGSKYGIDKNEGNMVLGLISIPIIDACYSAAEPIVLPTLMPMIQKASKELEG